MATESEFFNSGSATTPPDPNRLTTPNFVEIGRETAEEIAGIAEKVLFHAKLEVFWISMAMVWEFPNSDKFSAVPAPSPSHRAVNEVSRPDGCTGRVFPTSEFY